MSSRKRQKADVKPEVKEEVKDEPKSRKLAVKDEAANDAATASDVDEDVGDEYDEGSDHSKDDDKKNLSASYEAMKKHDGKQYTGMRVGGHHTWDYEAGVWKEKKVAPDRWRIAYETLKTRRGFAPEGSGVPVGTEYNWFIVGHQMVKKINANSYTTKLEGVKYKAAHKRADHDEWSIKTEYGRKKREIALLEHALDQARKELAAMPGGAGVHHKLPSTPEKGQKTLLQLFQRSPAKPQ